MNRLEKIFNKLMGNPLEKTDKLLLKSRCIKKGKYEVSGIIFDADSHEEAIRKYRRARDETKDV